MILDVCCNKGLMWNGKKPIDYIGIDLELDFKPILRADAKFLPIKNNSIDIITCDPPFWIRKSPINFNNICGFTNMIKNRKYGIWRYRFDWIKFLLFINKEFARVLKNNGELLFKVLDGVNNDVSHLSELGYLKAFKIDNIAKFKSRSNISKCVTCWVKLKKV